jgi:peptidoglycan/xylan/chitin deacetylase (PgdA/CDA1 family)
MKIRSRHLKIATLCVARLFGGFAMARFITRNQLRILCYHGGVIGDESHYNPKLFSSASALRERMQWLKRRSFNFLSLDEATGMLGTAAPLKTLPVVVTFDDGWYSTVDQLLPVLSDMDIPSTLYLSTEQYLRSCPVPGVTVRYTIWKARPAWAAITGFPGVDGPYDLSQESDRNHLANTMTQWIVKSTSSREEFCAALARFAACLGVPAESLQLETRRFDYITREEMLRLKEQGCQVELHGHVHRYPKGDVTAFIDDLRTCSQVITSAGLPEPKHYCYPSGSFDKLAGEVLGQMGLVSATTCMPGLIKAGTPRFYLSRFLDGGSIHALEFEAEMSGFLHLLRGALRLGSRSPAGATVRPACAPDTPMVPELSPYNGTRARGTH